MDIRRSVGDTERRRVGCRTGSHAHGRKYTKLFVTKASEICREVSGRLNYLDQHGVEMVLELEMAM